MATYHAPTPTYHRSAGDEKGGGVLLKVVALFLGIAVGILAVAAVVMMQAADEARDDVNAVAGTPATDAATGHDHASHSSASTSAVGLPLQSFAGKTAADAEALAKAHVARDAALPAVPAGDLVKVHMTLKDMVVEIAPGVRYNTWAFDGHGAPGPVIHVRQGQTVEMTLTNGGSIPHSIDFHAARIAPNVAFADVLPGESFTFRFTAGDPGVFMYHCGTKPVLAHIANGMYGAIVVSPATPLPRADKEYVLVASEWYLNGDGVTTPASLDMAKARAMMPDWTTFNGYANQYVTHPLTAEPGETVRFYVVAAGPTLDTNFHVVGTILDRAWVNGDMTRFQQGVQTVGVPAGGGAVFDVKIDKPGLYPFVSHAFAHVDLGQVGLLKVGDVKGTMSH
ncbi:MAG TPA: multicopper oxidase domain-containing protein [Gaiellaceae bacterium]|nr:multicopper oxidase domain-containing protein [Gaiellaceae bacterium]